MTQHRLEIVQIRSGKMDNFAYLVFCPRRKTAIAVDPSFEPEKILDAARERDLGIEMVVNTHGHRDHVIGNDLLLEATGARLAAHPLDLPSADPALEEGFRLHVGDGEVEILHTPGHSPGSITLHLPGALITGDTLFITRVGRADLSGSDPGALYGSLRRLAAFPPDTLIYPGHDYGPQPVSTVAFENEHNPFLRCSDLESFLQLRMG